MLKNYQHLKSNYRFIFNFSPHFFPIKILINHIFLPYKFIFSPTKSHFLISLYLSLPTLILTLNFFISFDLFLLIFILTLILLSNFSDLTDDDSGIIKLPTLINEFMLFGPLGKGRPKIDILSSLDC
jgi:hypothetical protein